MLRSGIITGFVALVGASCFASTVAGRSAAMVFVPGGQFEMGDHHDGETEALPVHAVDIGSFYMDKFEVTNRQYCDYLNSGRLQGMIEVNGGVVRAAGGGDPYCNTNEYDSESQIHWDGVTFTVTPGREDHPVVEVSWYGAAAYANWRSVRYGLTPSYDSSTWECDFDAGGYRLPTEAEWEGAARGGEYDPYYRYPVGDVIDGSMANFSSSGDPYEVGDYPWTTPVGYYDGHQMPSGPSMGNGYGLYDMAGNVSEWCNDWYDFYAYCDPSPCDNPCGPQTGLHRVWRGGSWLGPPDLLRIADREFHYPQNRYGFTGFRLVLPREDPPVPTVSTWGLVTTVLLLLSAGTVVLMKRWPAVA